MFRISDRGGNQRSFLMSKTNVVAVTWVFVTVCVVLFEDTILLHTV